jgi:hypothetical protein
LTTLLQEETCYSFIDVDNVEAFVTVNCVIIIIREAFTLAHKLSLKGLRPSDWLALASSNEIAFVKKALDRGFVLIMPDQWREAVQEIEKGDSASVKVRKQRQNTTCFDPNRPQSHS